MLNKLLSFIREYRMLSPGDHVVCAVSGGADSIALVYAMKLLSEKLEITVSAAHFNHRLRGEESDADEAFVRAFCQRHDIALQVGSGEVVPGKKGLEAAARNARYGFLHTLQGKVATAHTADDNAETLLLHLLRGTGLKGLGGIRPVYGQLIRPMLTVTRQQVLAFLQEYSLDYVNDSSNGTDLFMRNRLRHHVMPLLRQENPRLAENLSATALRLREDEKLLSQLALSNQTADVEKLRDYPAALRRRVLAQQLKDWGVPEPEAEHVALAEKLVFSGKPSARASFPGGVLVSRHYGKLEKCNRLSPLESILLSCPGEIQLPQLGLRVICRPAQVFTNDKNCFTVSPVGNIWISSRRPGDRLRRSGGSKSLKDLFIDSKIPASERDNIPVLRDDLGVLGLYGFGADRDRLASQLPAVQISFECI